MSGECNIVLNQRELRDGVVVAVSGGVDSVVLLDCIVRRMRRRAPVVVAHVNYHLRPESNDDAAFVQKIALQYDLSYHMLDCRAPDGHENVQAWARDRRYEFCAQLAAGLGIRSVATGHHADDQAETVLWNLLRGTGLQGLRGMQAERYLAEQVQLVRPMLHITRADILRYAEKRGLKFREDASNQSDKYTRNNIRHHLLPLCEDLVSGAAGHIAQLADHVQRDHAALHEIAEEAVARLASLHAGEEARWSRQEFLQLPEAVQRRFLRLIFTQLTDGNVSLAAHHVRKMTEIIHGAGLAYMLPGPHVLERHGQDIVLRRGRLRAAA